MSAVWLVSKRFDFWVFLAPAILALALVPLADWIAPNNVTPEWAWVLIVVGVDVAHVWSTIFISYLDVGELRRRPGLYAGAPLVAYGCGLAVALISFEAFWRCMAYLAVFHFVRQQYGWVRLYARQDGTAKPWDRHLDTAAIYGATLYPVLWWHAHLPRHFEWFVPDDFVSGVPVWLADLLLPVYGLVLVAFFLRQLHRGVSDDFVPWGKVWMVASTAACWGVGIMLTNSDWAFTITNVLMHGVPYIAFIWVVGANRDYGRRSINRWIFGRGHWWAFLAVLFGLTYVEEYLWDRVFWMEHGSIFWGPELVIDAAWVPFGMALLSVPQVTHYILDGFIWKRPKARGPDA